MHSVASLLSGLLADDDDDDDEDDEGLHCFREVYTHFTKLEAGPVVTLKRVVATRRVQTFFCGWNKMMWTLGAKRQPNTTDPLRLTEMHMKIGWKASQMMQVVYMVNPMNLASLKFSGHLRVLKA
ncbi:hypothetical protein EYF80_004277 [Liparis tanakae]|uniref:Uncharacterized protein n=1 Tax=Liparis tanakae TaxID=230148 RepID=A0A4Z2J6W7_9TELE|nr:hypothetical protein EYF80_004277 [Liparis tanakae]